MNHQRLLYKVQLRRKVRVRAKIRGNALIPRLSIFRSNRFTSAQLIDDETGKTLASVSSRTMKSKENKSSVAFLMGEVIAQKAKELKLSRAVVDRGAYRYHGRIKALVEGARKGGLSC